MTTTAAELEPEEIAQIGAELDSLRRRVVEDLGAADAEYIRGVVATQRLCEVSGRVLLFAGWFPPAWFGGVAALACRRFSTTWRSVTTSCPDGTEVFAEEESEDETRGKWYLRQMLGSANITGSPLFHLLSGNLSHQIEHHLFPGLPVRSSGRPSGWPCLGRCSGHAR